MLKRPPYGIIPAMVTPLTAEDQINERALRRLTNHLIDGGSHAVFAIGSQGEFWAFSADEKRRVWEIVVDEAAGRVPVYAGSAAVTTREAIQLTRLAEEAGVDAVSVLTPYFISPNDNQLYDHYKAIAEATRLPVLLYSNPARTGVKLAVSLVARLAEVPNIVGIKDSSGDLELAAEYMRVAPEKFSVLMGRDTLIYAGLLYGARGAIAATANVKPRLVADIYDKFIAGDLDGARQAQQALAPLRLAFGWGTFPVVIKEALDLMGMEGGPGRAPVGPLSADQREKLRGVLKDMGVV
ncbi:MAG: 4-hydroxy-tetrahydrodipicolinate synthase [Chloroflexi bacterium RBG_13_68_17]|nr:MAG: 4-hydroxy-tetrahydrodipicolinate synthase [Chloroflexi bacterium RBG_13_68_17]